ncbi:MAG TPA: serine protease [Candidatus Omnitrophota bacterium]|nr:serine protease [Candidatus Omnitrophota bacterium]
MRITIRLSALVLAAFLSVPAWAQESPIHHVLEKGKAVVSIEAIDAAVYKDKPQGVLDRATGRMVVVQRMRRVASVQVGGGIILDSRGIIVTAAHTLKNKKNIMVTLFDGTRLPAKILRKVSKQDLAFLSVQPSFPLDSFQFANSDAAPVGMPVFAMGRAQWIEGTLTGGEISALGIEKIDGVNRATSFQIDFKAYKGDSGSPILDGRGRLLGMISAGRVVGSKTYAITSNMIATAYRRHLSR